jgi:signal transduction histidine kinase
MGTNGYQRIHLSVGRSWFEPASPSAPERGLLPWLLGRGRVPVQSSSIPDTLDDRMKDFPDHASIRANPQLSLQKAAQSIASRYEVLMAVSVAIGTHHDIEGLFSALATELLRVVDFDFIGMSQYEESTKKVEWHLSKSGSQIERGVIDGTKEETMSAWVYRHQKPMILGSLNQETKLHRKIKELAQDGIQSLCAFPLTCVHHRMGCFLIGNKQKDAYSEDEIRFLSVVTDMIASAVDDAINFDALRQTQAELRSERDRLQLLLELTSQIASNLELRELLRTVSATVRRVMRCDAVAVHLPDEERGCLRIFALDFEGRTSVTADNSGLEESNSAEYISEVFRTRTPMVHGEGSLISIPEIFRDVPRTSCSVPLVSRNRVLGVMELWRPEAHVCTQVDLEFLMQIAKQVAIAIENALAYGEIKGLKTDLAHTNRVSTMGELVASISHELAQPITVTTANAKASLRWLQRDPPDLTEVRKGTERIIEAGSLASEIIDRLRSLYKKSSPKRELVAINEVIGDMVLLLRGEANEYAVSIRTGLAADLPEIAADRVQLQQVLMNLMLNGIEAMRETGGVLTVKTGRGEGDQVLISVSDTGVGLPAGRADGIFNAFFTTKPQGSGMGLAISRSIVESHGGRLWATSHDGRGATFQFTLPTTVVEVSAAI